MSEPRDQKLEVRNIPGMRSRERFVEAEHAQNVGDTLKRIIAYFAIFRLQYILYIIRLRQDIHEIYISDEIARISDIKVIIIIAFNTHRIAITETIFLNKQLLQN